MVLVAAHAVGVFVMTIMARRQSLPVAPWLLVSTTATAALSLVLAWVLVGWPLTASVPVSVLLAMIVMTAVVRTDPDLRARIVEATRRPSRIRVP
jgi:hypothetical protein